MNGRIISDITKEIRKCIEGLKVNLSNLIKIDDNIKILKIDIEEMWFGIKGINLIIPCVMINAEINIVALRNVFLFLSLWKVSMIEKYTKIGNA